MPVANAYAGTESDPVLLGSLIPLKSTSITAYRNGVSLGAQTVRLETLSGDKQVVGPSGRTYSIDGMLLGYKGHPTIANTNLQAGDTFTTAEGVSFEVVAIMPAHTDCLQAFLHVRS